MSSGTISGAQVRAARALLGWTVHELAHRSIVSIVTIHEIEESAAAPSTHADDLVAIQAALKSAGIEFLDGAAPGVRLRPKARRRDR